MNCEGIIVLIDGRGKGRNFRSWACPRACHADSVYTLCTLKRSYRLLLLYLLQRGDIRPINSHIRDIFETL